MASIGRALMAGLVAGGAKYADMKLDEKQKAEQAERDRKLAELQMKLKQEAARFDASLRPDQYQTIEDTGPDGQTIKRTLRTGYDPERGKYAEEVGSAILPMKDDRVGVEREYELFQKDPKGYAAMMAAKKARVEGGGSGADGERVTFDVYDQWPQEKKDAYDRYKGRAARTDLDAKDRKWVTTETAVAMRDFNKKPAYEQAPLLKSAGIDPTDPDASKKYRNSIRDDLKTQMGIDLFEGTVRSGANTTAKEKPGNQSAPGSSRENPAPAQAFKEQPPSGTWVKLPSGQVIQIP